MKNKDLKTFAIISLGWLGDTLLNAALCQDIKKNYPDSKVIFIASKPFVEIAKGVEGVDEAFYYDKKDEHKGIFGVFKFAKNFPYKNKIDCAIITHAQERSILLGSALGAKIKIAAPKKGLNPINCLISHKFRYTEEEIRNTYKADFNSDYIKLIGAKPRLSEVKFNIPSEYEEKTNQNLRKNGWDGSSYIVLSPLSKDEYKDWSFENIQKFVNKYEKNIVLVGTGKAEEIAKKLNAPNLIDMTNKTTIFELAQIFKNAQKTVSVDTGTMHLSYAVGTDTLCLFFKEAMVAEWAPKDGKKHKILIGKKYNSKNGVVCEKDITAEDVISALS